MWAAAAKEMRLCENNISANTKVSAEVEGGGAPGVEAEIPLRPMVTQAVPLQLMDDPLLEHRNAPTGDCDPMGSLQWAHSWQVLQREKPTLEQLCWHDLWPQWSSLFLKDCILWKEPTVEEFVKTVACGKDSCWRSSWRDSMLKQAKSIDSYPEGGRSNSENVWCTEHNPHFWFLCTTEG